VSEREGVLDIQSGESEKK